MYDFLLTRGREEVTGGGQKVRQGKGAEFTDPGHGCRSSEISEGVYRKVWPHRISSDFASPKNGEAGE